MPKWWASIVRLQYPTGGTVFLHYNTSPARYCGNTRSAGMGRHGAVLLNCPDHYNGILTHRKAAPQGRCKIFKNFPQKWELGTEILATVFWAVVFFSWSEVPFCLLIAVTWHIKCIKLCAECNKPTVPKWVPFRGPGSPRGPFWGFGSPLGPLFMFWVPFFSILD